MKQPVQSVDIERLRAVVSSTVDEARTLEARGKASDAIPEPEGGGAHRLGLCIRLADGQVVTGGEADERFSIQSISKVFALTLALESVGEEVWVRVGREPSDDPFNSIIDLERHEGVPRNPFINAGAIVVADILLGRPATSRISVRDFLARQTGDETIAIDEGVRASELENAFANRALANFAKSFGNFGHDVETVLADYIGQCAIAMSCRQLATAGRYLTSGRLDPARKSADEARRIRRVVSLMMTCGQYDGSGDFAFRVGLPAKSGVGGGILAIVPDTASIAVWSPELDENGNSFLGTLVLERLSERMGWSVFGSLETPQG